MDFYVSAKTYNCYGGHKSLSRIGDFLLHGSSGFGDAIKEISITLYFPHSGAPKKTLETLWDRHNSYRATLPKIVYHRAKRTVTINIASDLMDGGDWKPSPRLSLPLFVGGVDEIIDALTLLKKRLKASDAFDLDAFLIYCETARLRIPRSEDSLQELATKLEAADQAKREAMSPWERLGIDWDDFHRNSKAVLDDPFFWDTGDDFSPNGNDTGADLLEGYRDWLPRHKDDQPLRFLELLANQWGYPDIDAMDDETRDQAAVALAFAEIKLRGTCDEKALAFAMNAIARQRIRAEASAGWAYRESCLKSLGKLERKLLQVKNGL